MSQTLYKKKSLRFSGCGMSKAVRLQEHSESRKSSRSELVNLRRNIDHNDVDDSLLPESEPLNEKAVTATTVSKPLSRLEQLKKWKEEKALKKKIENENRQKAPFVVGKAKPEMGCSKVPLRSLQNSSTMFGAKNSSRFISKSVSSVSTARSTAGVTGKVNVPASTSGAKPPTKNVYLPASSGMKPPTKTGAASSTNQKAKPPSALPALSAAVRDKSQMKTNVPKTCASRLPTRNLPQGNQNLKMLESRIPACKPAMQQKKDVKEKKPIGKIDGKSNPPDRIGKISGKANCLAPPVFKSEKRDCGLKFPKPLPGLLPKPTASKNTVKKPVGDSKIATGKKIEPKRKSFAPENFKFAPTLPVFNLDLSVFEGIDFSRKTSTPFKETKDEVENNETESRHLLNDISECKDEIKNKNKNTVAEVDTDKNTDVNRNIIENENYETVNKEKENIHTNSMNEVETINTDTEVLPNIATNVNVSQHISEEIFDSEQNKAKQSESEKNELMTEMDDKNITRRHKMQDGNSVVEIIGTEFESLSGVKPPEVFFNKRLCSIQEELETSSCITPKSHRSSLRRSSRLATKLAKNTLVNDENAGLSTEHEDLFEAFNQLQMNSKQLSLDELEPELQPKMNPKKVSLLYTPPSSRYSLRKSVKGDLMSFS